MKVPAKARDHPGWVNGFALVLAIGLGAAASVVSAGSLPHAQEGDTALADVFLAAAGVSAIFAGFGGVLVTLGLSLPGERFTKLRRDGGNALIRNWVSIVSTGFLAAFAALGAALLLYFSLLALAWVSFALCMLLNVHCAARQVWLVRALALVVRASDNDDSRVSL